MESKYLCIIVVCLKNSDYDEDDDSEEESLDLESSSSEWIEERDDRSETDFAIFTNLSTLSLCLDPDDEDDLNLSCLFDADEEDELMPDDFDEDDPLDLGGFCGKYTWFLASPFTIKSLLTPNSEHISLNTLSISAEDNI
uniref:MATH domain-containing protein n=1 Tax=Rhabditophanes sp. KR3021 TaxID=114890 RepID=A0AC35TJT6_9BILA